MALVEENKIEQVVVFSFSRFARSTTHLLKALQKFREKNVRFHSITEAMDTNSPMGVALLTILGALAHYAEFGDMRSERRIMKTIKSLALHSLRIISLHERGDQVVWRSEPTTP